MNRSIAVTKQVRFISIKLREKAILAKPFAAFLHYICSSVNTGETSSSPVKSAIHS